MSGSSEAAGKQQTVLVYDSDEDEEIKDDNSDDDSDNSDDTSDGWSVQVPFNKDADVPLHFAIPEGTRSITQLNPNTGEGHDSWREWRIDKEKVTSVAIPPSVTSIGELAFEGCIFLVSVDIPMSVTSIEERAFTGCISLASVDIPPSVTRISMSAFRGCRSLTKVDIPTSVTSIGMSAFFKCSSLMSIAIPASMNSIEDGAFEGCSSLEIVDIPTSVTSITAYVFSDCSSLTSVAIPSSVTSIEENAFSGCSSLASVAIPLSVTEIAGGAFDDCYSLTSAEIPASIATLGTMRDGKFHGAFEGCTTLIVLMIQPINMDDHPAVAAAADAAADAATAAATSAPAIVKALHEQNQFASVAQFWATDDIISELTGLFEGYTRLENVPREMLAAPDAKTWAGVQLWLWWLPPIVFSEGNIWKLQPYPVGERIPRAAPIRKRLI